MTIYQRSDTALDRDGLFTPQSFLGAGRRRRAHALRGNQHRMSLGQIDDWGTGIEGEFDWNSLIETGAQVYTTYTAAELQKDLAQLNLTRASQGLAPIPASAVAPQVNVGLGADTQKTLLYLGLGVAAILGGAYAFGVIGKGKKRRR